MMRMKIKVFVMVVAGMSLVCLACANARAGERTGNLVFKAMKKMEDAHKVFLGDVKQIRAGRVAAAARRDAARERYRKAKPGSMDRQEFHARYCLEEARVLSAIREETALTNRVSARQLGILKNLYRSIDSGRETATPREIRSVLRAATPVLEDGRKLLSSLGRYSGRITDPVIHSRLRAAAGTARMLRNYTKSLNRGAEGNLNTQTDLKRRLADLIQQLNAVYAQTDILAAMIQDKAAVLKMVNELAATEAFFSVLSDGKGIVSNLSEGVMASLVEAVEQSDQDLNLLMEGVYLDDASMAGGGVDRSWTEGY